MERELVLLQPEIRRDRERFLSLLHPDFTEYGSSGRVWDRTTITHATGAATDEIEATAVEARRLGADAVLVTYRSHAGQRQALRSSTWVRDHGTWLLLFHQGTLVPGA